MQDIDKIIESLLFVAEEPLTVEKLRGILETVDSREIRSTLQGLADEYDRRGSGFWLKEVAGGWQIRSRPEYHEWIKRMLQPAPQRLSRAALETLAVVAYKQPIIRADIEHIRGVDCGGVLRQLMERKFIRVLGRKEIAGRPLIYATTKLFLEMFDLKDLNDLPTPKEIAEFGNIPVDEAQKDLQDRSSDTSQLTDNEVEVQTVPLDDKPPLLETQNITEENHSMALNDSESDSNLGKSEVSSDIQTDFPSSQSSPLPFPGQDGAEKEIIDSPDKPLEGDAETSVSEEDDIPPKNS